MPNSIENNHKSTPSESSDQQISLSHTGSDNQVSDQNEDEHNDIEAMRRLIAEFIRSASKVNEGNNGVIFRNILEITKEEPEGKVERKDYAAKMLKVGNFSDLQSEHENQRQAYQILQEALEKTDEPEKYARIPAVDFCELIDVDDELASRLTEQGVSVKEGKVGVMMMDWVDGEDLATHLFKEVISRENARREAMGQDGIYLGNQPSFNQIHAAAGQLLDFRIPGGKGSTEAERLVEKEKVEDQNEQRVYAFLKKSGYKFPEATIAQIENTIVLLRENGFTLWDNHLRNAMINSESGQAYLIDFAPFDKWRTQEFRDPDALSMVRKLRNLTTSVEEDVLLEKQAKTDAFMSEYQRVIQNERWLGKYIQPFKDSESFFDNLDLTISSSSNPADIDEIAFALMYQMKASFVNPGQVNEFLDQMIDDASYLPWRFNALKAVKQQIEKAET